MNKKTYRKLAGIGVVLLAFGILLIAAGLQGDEKLQATLSDGTIIKIEKVEVTKTPSYDPRNPWQKLQTWFYERPWAQGLLSSLKIKTFNKPRAYTPSKTYDKDTFCIWFSLSDPNRGFFPETVTNLLSGKHSGTFGTSGIWDKAYLTDEDGCTFSRGWLHLDSQKIGSQTEIVYVFSFESFNNTARQQNFSIKLPGEKEPSIFTLKNPNPKKVLPASSLARPLPVQQSVGGVSIILERFSGRKNRFSNWSGFRFERNGVAADKDYAVVSCEASDSQGGCAGDLCAKAGEWIITGFARPKRMESTDAAKRILLEDLSRPNSRKHYEINLPENARKFFLKAHLVGAGIYVADEGNILSTGGLGDLKKQREFYEGISQPRNFRTGSQTQSDGYWQEKDKKNFFWEQRIFDNRTQKLLLLTNRPALLLRVTPEITGNNALLIASPVMKGNHCEADFSNDQWRIIPLDWKKSDDPQAIEIGYAEAMPFELHILPTEEMRQSVLSSSGKKK